MAGLKTSRQSDQFKLRLPDGMRDRLSDEAARNGRSITQEIISRLEASFAKTDETGFDEHELSEAVKKAVLEVVAGKVGPVLTVRDMTTPKKNSMTRRPKD